jgi:IclR family acetate operon transcriptional repressor
VPRDSVRSVRRAAAILDALASSNLGLTTADMARKLSLHPSTCHHLVNTLEFDHLLARNADGTYRLGPQVLYLASRSHGGLPFLETLTKELDELNARTRETSYLVAWENDEMTVIAARLGLEAVVVGDTRLGLREHPHAKASGQVMLAFSPQERRQRFLRSTQLVARTPYTVTDHDGFIEKLDGIRQTGYAVEIEEYALGVACLASPIRYRDADSIGSLAISVPLERFQHNRTQLEAEVHQAGHRASTIFSALAS